ncbi:HMG box protein [Arthroderma uncinatum]|uniref:HMG box protein n=1 Tax=Arthroderma uncinatum TaxID=74035 RepID=UPI00144AAD25|nr:HMG box protein [Arthroderma uncinatum]KAF3481528.1 HMG box protein [Arthroderma uncinatum]
MEAWVNRPVETRLNEAKIKNGKIARPMNSFMLYRSAYAERTKEWCSQNNHQVVSRASGQSWRLEPREIRDQYRRYAATERHNHHKAHPGYKFAPNRKQNTPMNQNGAKSLSAAAKEDLSDSEDQGFNITSHPRLANRRRTLGPRGDINRSQTSTPCDNDSIYKSGHSTPVSHSHRDTYRNGDINRSQWEVNNPGGTPHPGIISQPHYYPPSMRHGLNIEDVTYTRIGMPGGVTCDTAASVTIMPGSNAELLQPQTLSHTGIPVPMNEVPVDPRLLEFDHTRTPLLANNGSSFGDQPDSWQFPLARNQHYLHGYMSVPEIDQCPYTMLPPS